MPQAPVFKAAIHEIVRWKPGLLQQGHHFWREDHDRAVYPRWRWFHPDMCPQERNLPFQSHTNHIQWSVTLAETFFHRKSGPKILRWPGPTFTTRKPNIFIIARLRRPDSVMFLQYHIISDASFIYICIYPSRFTSFRNNSQIDSQKRVKNCSAGIFSAYLKKSIC